MAPSVRMLRTVAIAALLVGLTPAAAPAQTDEAPAAPPAGEVRGAVDPAIEVDPATGRRYRVERPPDGMRRGRLSVPRWAVIATGAAAGLGAAVALGMRLRRRRGGRG